MRGAFLFYRELSTMIAKTKISLLLFGLLSSFSIYPQSLQEILSQGETDSKSKKETNSRSVSNSRIPSPQIESHSVGIGIGQTFLKSDLGRSGDDKITWDLYYQYRASRSFDFIANFHLMEHKLSKTYTRTSGLALGIKARVFQFDNFSPYILGGFGFYQPKISYESEGSTQTSETKTTFGWHLGGGAELQLNKRFSTGVLLHIHNPFSIEQENARDVSGWYYKLLITGMYTF